MNDEWGQSGPVAGRGDVIATAELADVRRILTVDVTAATIIPSHEWALRDSAPVRIEIHAGTSLAEVQRALGQLLQILPVHWEYFTDELGAAAIAKEYERVDLRAGTIDGIPVAGPTPGHGKVAKIEDGSKAV